MPEPGQWNMVNGREVNTDPVEITSVTEAPSGRMSRVERLQLDLQRLSMIARIIAISPFLGPIKTWFGIQGILKPPTAEGRVLIPDYTLPPSTHKD